MSRPAFVYVSYIATTPERLWAALTESAFTTRYWSGTRVESDWRVGSPLTLATPGMPATVGVVLASEPPRRLSYTFHPQHDGMERERPSRVTFELEPVGALVKLTLTHDEFPDDSRVLPAISQGWPAVVSSLKSLLERGEALDFTVGG